MPCKYKLKDGVYYMNCDGKEIPVDIDAPPQFKAKENNMYNRVAKFINKNAGTKKGPGIPDGTGPLKDTDECPFNKKEKVEKQASDPIFKEVEKAIKGQKLLSIRKSLETIFPKKSIDFSFSPQAHYRIKHKGKTLVIVSKKYADDAELIVDDMALGYLGTI